MNKYYVAYGSNLNLKQMKNRAPNASIYGTSYIINYRLLFKGTVGRSYLTIEKEEGYKVPVAVFKVNNEDELNLDFYEDYPSLYYKKEIKLDVLDKEGNLIKNVPCFVYIMYENFQLGEASSSYIEECVEGYKDFNFDPSYIEEALKLTKKNNMKKILVVGCPGSGKSTFSIKLAKILNLPLYHLDNIFWNEDKTHLSNEEFDLKLQEILLKEEWIIDGDYFRTYEERIITADTIFLLDYEIEVCLEGITSRIGKKREDLPWIELKLDDEFVELVKRWKEDKYPYLIDLLNKYNNKNIITFKNREEANKYLEEKSN